MDTPYPTEIVVKCGEFDLKVRLMQLPDNEDWDKVWAELGAALKEAYSRRPQQTLA
jgi:hypothetical protein